jgi:multiple antibiotic resistance protein
MALTDLNQFLGTLTLAIAALLPIVNPLGGAPIFLAKTYDLTEAERAGLARAVAIDCFILLVASTLVGAYVLDFFGLSVPAVRVAGGLVVCAIAWSLLMQADSAPAPPPVDAVRQAVSRQELARRAFYPLTMPLTVGPGSISVAITLGANPPSTVRAHLMTAIAHALGMLAIAVIIYLCYRYAATLLRKLGDVGTVVVTRLAAFILLCVGVQIVWNGVVGLVRELPA